MRLSDLKQYNVVSTNPAPQGIGQQPGMQAENQPQDNRIFGKTQTALNTVFGGAKIGEAIGTQIAKRTPGGRELQRQIDDGEVDQSAISTLTSPSGKEIAGDVARTALTFAPVGRLAQGAKAVGSALGITGKTAAVGSNIIAGGTTGAAFDVAEDVSENRDIALGGGTFFGAGIPAAAPLIGAISRVTARIAGRGASEITGKLTGTSSETVEQAFIASRAGGQQLDELTASLRGQTTPEELVNSMRESVAIVSQNRSQLFSETLSELSNEVVTTNVARDSFKETLEGVGITINDNNTLNFANNKLRNVTEAQKKITQAWEEISSMPDQLAIKDLDVTRQAVKAIKEIAGDDPSANLANMLIEDATRSVRKAGEQVEGYGTMLDNFGESSEFLTELQKSISSGDNVSIDQAYRRIATTLKTNNEQRMALVRELDEATDGALLSKITGQQLSEALPRGLVGTYLAPVLAGGVIAGGVTPAIIPGLLLASPRAVGEFSRALGIGAAKADAFIDAIAEARGFLIKTGAIVGAETDNSPN